MARPPDLETDAAGLSHRHALWEALSELWLDTGLQPRDIERLARAITATPYTLAQVRAIHESEVAPAVSGNLTLVTGEWAYFDPAWLRERCTAQARLRDVPGHRLAAWLRRPWVRFHTGDLWRRIEARLADTGHG
ncbi:MAG: hypothetical protein ACJ8IK_28760 [Burkholderiaceae bacterium]